MKRLEKDRERERELDRHTYKTNSKLIKVDDRAPDDLQNYEEDDTMYSKSSTSSSTKINELSQAKYSNIISTNLILS